jgi:cytochrome P450
MTHGELKIMSSILIIASSETSATLLSGAIFYLLKNPKWLSRLQEELEGEFKSESEMSFVSLSPLKVLHAIIQETFRLYPPVAGDLPRVTPSKGAIVCGTYIPPHTRISIPMYPAYRSALNFRDPETYAPERWLGAEKYADDKRSVLQPFSIGPRNCVGQSLAWAEIRTVLARLVWHFDMELMEESKDWEKQKVFIMWHKPSLMVRLKARKLTR